MKPRRQIKGPGRNREPSRARTRKNKDRRTRTNRAGVRERAVQEGRNHQISSRRSAASSPMAMGRPTIRLSRIPPMTARSPMAAIPKMARRDSPEATVRAARKGSNRPKSSRQKVANNPKMVAKLTIRLSRIPPTTARSPTAAIPKMARRDSPAGRIREARKGRTRPRSSRRPAANNPRMKPKRTISTPQNSSNDGKKPDGGNHKDGSKGQPGTKNDSSAGTPMTEQKPGDGKPGDGKPDQPKDGTNKGAGEQAKSDQGQGSKTEGDGDPQKQEGLKKDPQGKDPKGAQARIG